MTYQGAILDTFRSAGEPLSTRGLAHLCISTGVFPPEWLESAALRAAQDECRKALKQSDINGLPFAGKTNMTDDAGAPLWVQREMWDFETYKLNIQQYVEKRDANHKFAVLLAKDCRRKFGITPLVPGLDALMDDAA